MSLRVIASVVAVLLCGVSATGATPVVEAKTVSLDTKISSVTLYRGRAAVTRTATVPLEPGVYDLRIENLPESIQAQTIQARAHGATNVLNVDFAQEQGAAGGSGQIAQLDAEIERLQLAIEEVAQQRNLIKAQEQFLDSIAARAAEQARSATGTAQFDLDAVRQQLDFVASERTKLLTARRELDAKERDLQKQLQAAQARRQAIAGAGGVNRVATVSIVATESGPATLELIYLVANATWEPAYNVRAVLDGSTAQVEYDALLTQRTGEDWHDVRLVLSTAQPTLAANPPRLQPWFVEVRRPVPATAGPRRAELEAPTDVGFPFQRDLKTLGADAEVIGEGPAVSFELPRAVTVKTDIQKQQRTRIATINTKPQFVHVAVPALTEAVYVRGDLVNSSAYQLLPGRASIFIGQDYVGPTTLGSVAPNGDLQIHFGIDPGVKATRQMVTKRTEATGLLSGGRRTNYDYRLLIDNGANRPITIELWDRYPISRSDEIQIDVVDLSHPLAADAKYLAEERPQGLLKWVLQVPNTARGRSSAVVTYGVRINRAKDVEMTPLPE